LQSFVLAIDDIGPASTNRAVVYTPLSKKVKRGSALRVKKSSNQLGYVKKA